MGRRAESAGQPVDARRAVLDAARELFAERGFDGTAVQDVATAVGVTKQAVLHHFATKEALREAVLVELLGHWGATLPRLLAEASGGYEQFHAVFGELVRFFCGEPSWARLVVRELLDRPGPARERLRSDVRPWIDLVASYVRAGQAAGRLREDADAEAWALEMLQLTLFGAATHAVLAGALSGAAEQRLAEELTRIARSSLFAARGRGRGPKGRKT